MGCDSDAARLPLQQEIRSPEDASCRLPSRGSGRREVGSEGSKTKLGSGDYFDHFPFSHVLLPFDLMTNFA